MTPAPRRVRPHRGGAIGHSDFQSARPTLLAGGPEQVGRPPLGTGFVYLAPSGGCSFGQEEHVGSGCGWRACLNSWAASRDPLDTPRYEVTERPRGVPARPAFTVTW